jgi:hypothetical protein
MSRMKDLISEMPDRQCLIPQKSMSLNSQKPFQHPQLIHSNMSKGKIAYIMSVNPYLNYISHSYFTTIPSNFKATINTDLMDA